ncbi:HpcH/HpaI aldolase/citrate lyase family protein [Hydrogenophaga sp.]|uniref:HpcH/HpaI aldolase family protein n=1 Tax=Hydrogenophaga sp. TaxID=1904254 RepID=UPI002728DCE4|nr:aldolase/citrate lyase family protein [Hydrogenophaga sp.]MDO9436260.1 aldolase/citrate lyase family protein [Hydrogenophaga sp.]
MRANPMKDIWARGGAVVSAWLSIPSPITAEMLGHQGYDVATLDLQHGMISFEQMLHMFQALSATPAMPMARLASNDATHIGRVLDAGAYSVICPMINSAKEAEAFVSACRYYPHGVRSYAPVRGQIYGGPDYFPKANDEIVKLAMVETRAGFDALDEILAVDGLDGIFIGPNDLAIAFGCPPVSESDHAEVRDAIAHVCERTRAAGKVAGILCSGPQAALKRVEQGFSFVSAGGDIFMLAQAAKNSVAAFREGQRVAAAETV